MRRILVLFAVAATVLAGCGGKDKDDEAGGSRAGGNKFTRSGPVNAAVWPNDGIVALQSALATDVGDPVLPHRRCYTSEDTHSIYVSDQAKLPEPTALMWDPRVFDVLRTAIDDAPKALERPTREGCPAPTG